MTGDTEEINIKVKSDIGNVSKDASNAATEFKVMGVSLNGVKKAFAGAAVTAKGMFGSIRAGMISTGIGAFVVAIGSLVSYFTNTKRGADKLERAMAGLGAVVDVLTDRFSELGGIILDTFQDPMPALKSFGKGLIKLLRDPTGATIDMFVKAGLAINDFKEEIVEETAAMTALKQRTQELRDADMEFMIQKAKTRQEIERARLIAEDETKSAEERLTNLKKALELEEKTTNRELELARERMEIQKQEMALSENLVEDEQKLAELKTAIIEKETASIKMRRRVVTEVNALEREILAEEKSRAKDKEDLNDGLNEQILSATALLDSFYESQLSAIDKQKNAIIDKYFAIIEAEEEGSATRLELEKNLQSELDAVGKKAAEKKVKWSEMTEKQQLGIMSSTAGNMATILGEETEAGKAFAVTQATIDTFASAQAAFKSMAGIPYVGPALGAIAAAAAVAGGIANIKAIQGASSSGPSGGGGGGGARAQAPAPQMMSGAFDISGGIKPEPVKAFVVTDEMTSSQDQLANIRRRATI